MSSRAALPPVPPLRLVAWEITRSCVLACRHCRAAAEKGPYAGELTTEECRRFLDSLATMGSCIVILTGGEPLMRSDIYEVAAYGHGKGLRMVLATCGLLLNDDSCNKLKNAGIARISLSIDGATAASHDAFRKVDGAFEGVMNGIAAARKAGLAFQINTTITRSNLSELPEIFNLAVKLGAESFHPFMLVPTGRGTDLTDEVISAADYERTLRWINKQQAVAPITIKPTCAPHYYRITRQDPVAPFVKTAPHGHGHGTMHSHGHPSLNATTKGCLGGQGFAFVSHTGSVQICGFLPVEAGNIRKTDYDFGSIWRESPLFNEIRDVNTYHGKCGCCDYWKVCGGCRARAFSINNDYLGEEPFCLYQPNNRKQKMIDFSKSSSAFKRAKEVLVGGVNSPVRAFKSVGRDPVFIASGSGAWMTDIDGNRYLDFVGSWGPMLLGHAHPEVMSAINGAVKNGCSFGAPTEGETVLAEKIISMVPSVEMVRFVNSGTEATMSAIRLARGVTKRDKIIKFEGCYHGHGDAFLIAAGSGALTLGIPDSPGVTDATAQDTLLARFNDSESVIRLFEQYGDLIAAVIVEPVAGNMGVVPPVPGFLQFLREITSRYGALLIFDEVMTGFRVAEGGAQKRFGVTPDITTLGKIIGGGMPIGAYGGSKALMEHVAPAGAIYQAGTLSGNPVAVASGLATLTLITSVPEIYNELERKSALLEAGMTDNCRALGIPAVINRAGSMLTLFFTDRESVKSFSDAKTSDTQFFGRYFNASLEEGIYLPPSQFEAMFISAAHSDIDITFAIEKNRLALAAAKG